MQRVKNKKKNKKIVVDETKLNKIKRDAASEAIDKACLVVLAAMVDELGIDDEQLCAVMKRTDRYAGYIKNHKAKIEDVRSTIEKGTGIRLKGWC